MEKNTLTEQRLLIQFLKYFLFEHDNDYCFWQQHTCVLFKPFLWFASEYKNVKNKTAK